MFDLAQAITQQTDESRKNEGPSGCSLFYQTEQCQQLILEVFRFEGWQAPNSLKTYGKNPKVEDVELQQIIVIEMNQSNDIVEDVKQFAHELPNHKGIVIIGQEDTISTMRALKDMGFYYLLWPLNKSELTDFLKHVHSNQQRFSGVLKNRKAKRVAVIGTKGGVGATLVGVELAACLADGGAETILVDHQYHYSSVDIMLGHKNLVKQNSINLAQHLYDMDAVSANDYLIDITKHLRLLAVEGKDSQDTLLSYSRSVSAILLYNANFIIEDFSAAISTNVDIEQLVEPFDILVLVLEPTVASVRAARQFMDQIKSYNLEHQQETRILLFLNYHRPKEAFSLTQAEVETHLEQNIDVSLNFDNRCSSLLLQGQRLHKVKTIASAAFNDLALLVHGKTLMQAPSVLNKLKGLFR